MYCPKCGINMNEVDMFCPQCGASLNRGKNVPVNNTGQRENTDTFKFQADKILCIISAVLILISLFIPCITVDGTSYTVIMNFLGFVFYIIIASVLFVVGKFTGKKRTISIIGCILVLIVLFLFIFYIITIEILYQATLGIGLGIGIYLLACAGILDIISVCLDKRKGVKFCRDCGAKINKNDKFCPHCGSDLSKRKTANINNNQGESTDISRFQIDKILCIISTALILITFFVPFETRLSTGYTFTNTAGAFGIILLIAIVALFIVGKFTGETRIISIIGCVAFLIFLIVFTIIVLTTEYRGSGWSKYYSSLSTGFYLWASAGILDIISVYIDKRPLV